MITSRFLSGEVVHSIPVSSFQLKLNCKGLVPQQMMTVSVTRWGNEDWGKKNTPTWFNFHSGYIGSIGSSPWANQWILLRCVNHICSICCRSFGYTTLNILQSSFCARVVLQVGRNFPNNCQDVEGRARTCERCKQTENWFWIAVFITLWNRACRTWSRMSLARSVIAFLRKFFDSKPQVYWWVVKRTMEMTQTIRRRVVTPKREASDHKARNTFWQAFRRARIVFCFPLCSHLSWRPNNCNHLSLSVHTIRSSQPLMEKMISISGNVPIKPKYQLLVGATGNQLSIPKIEP